MDPIRQLSTPIAEIRATAPVRDEYGEAWVMLDGVETKVPDIETAKALLVQQDATRVKIREDMDALGLREDNETVTLRTEDGIEYEAELVPVGKASYMQIANIPVKSEYAPELATVEEMAKLEKQKSPGFFSRLCNIFRKDES